MYNRARIGASIMVLSFMFMAWMFAQNVAAAPLRQGATITSPAAAAGVSVAQADTETPTPTPTPTVGVGFGTPPVTEVCSGDGITSTLKYQVLELKYVSTEAKTAGQDVTSHKITIKFAADGSLSGSGGCNDYFGSYTVSG